MSAGVPEPATSLRWTFGAALGVSLLLLLLRLDLARSVGFGDAEALYVAYSLHPQPAYLDHPGLVGWFAHLLARGVPVTPERLHRVTSLLATLLPWVGVLAARALGADARRALTAFFALALVPELSIGLFALTPDLPLAFAWLLTLALGGLALRRPPGEMRTLLAYLGTGFAAAIACLAKASGALLALGVLLCALRRGELRRFRTLGPWAALLVFGIVSQPLLRWEVERGFPLLRHRLVTTQSEGGFSLLNGLRLLSGQLLYVTPPFLFASWLLARDLFRRRQGSAPDRLLQSTTLVAFFPLLLLCLYSAVAEPHWLAPAYLGLALHAARSDVVRRWLALSSLLIGLAMVGLGWAWVRTDLPIKVGDLLGGYEPGYDPSNDLYAWQKGGPVLADAVAQAHQRTGRHPIVVGPHWVVCAQAEVALGGEVAVGCNSPIQDDYDRWLPRTRWQSAPLVLFVTDSRFENALPPALRDYEVVSQQQIEVRRGERVVRSIDVLELERGEASASAGPLLGAPALGATALGATARLPAP